MRVHFNEFRSLANVTLREVRALVSRRSSEGKGHLQEIAARNGEKVEYFLLSAEGPDHMKTFEIEVRIGGKPYASASANSKKSAESKAARMAIKDYIATIQKEEKSPKKSKK